MQASEGHARTWSSTGDLAAASGLSACMSGATHAGCTLSSAMARSSLSISCDSANA